MAPEVINEEEIEVKDLEKVDLFSLGVMLYNLAFYSYPYEHINEQKEDISKILSLYIEKYLMSVPAYRTCVDLPLVCNKRPSESVKP